MNSTTEELIRNSSVKALKIREKREAAEERKKRQEQRDQEQTKLLIRKAKENGNVFIKYLLFQILDEYEKTPEAIANFDNNCFIWKKDIPNKWNMLNRELLLKLFFLLSKLSKLKLKLFSKFKSSQMNNFFGI